MNQTAKTNALLKKPPMAVELEAAVLGAILLEKAALAKALPLISTDEIFFVEKHQLIMQAIRNLFADGNPTDLLTVSQELRRMGKLQDAGGPHYVTELTSAVASDANIEYHCRILQEFWMKRKLIAIGAGLQKEGHEDGTDVFDLLNVLQTEVVKLVEGIDNGRTASLRDSLREALEHIKQNMGKADGLTGVPTPFTYLNGLTGGWQRTNLIIIAARPAMGKTALMMALARCALAANIGVGVFSLEMTTLDLTNRLIVQETKICTAEDLDRGRVSEEKLKDLTAKLSRAWNYNLHIDDTPGLSLVEFRSKAWAMKTHQGIGMILIDYLQLMGGESKSGKPNGNREQEIASISRGMKKVAKELDIPIIALSQVSRAVETRGGDKKPQLSDLRESGSIEQDADLVFFLYRAEYYGIKETPEGIPTVGMGELICAKHRKGRLGTTYMRFQPEYTDFVEWKESTAALPSTNYSQLPKEARSDFDFEPSPEDYDSEEEMPF